MPKLYLITIVIIVTEKLIKGVLGRSATPCFFSIFSLWVGLLLLDIPILLLLLFLVKLWSLYLIIRAINRLREVLYSR